ncbi:hypothetical protein J4457_02730 [Candidatus Woesearchaeota archaeon]|nr:hypothetical protein [Candidatus Woesearchaeota archaeon]
MQHLAFFPNVIQGIQVAAAFQERYEYIKRGTLSKEILTLTVIDCKRVINNLRNFLLENKRAIREHVEVEQEIINHIEKIAGLVRIDKEEIDQAEQDLKIKNLSDQKVKEKMHLVRTYLATAIDRLNKSILPELQRMGQLLEALSQSVEMYKEIMDNIDVSKVMSPNDLRTQIIKLESQRNIPLTTSQWSDQNVLREFQFDESETKKLKDECAMIRRVLNDAWNYLRELQPQVERKVHTALQPV